MRKPSHTLRILVFLLPFVWLVAGAIPGRPETGSDPSAPGWCGFDDLAVYSALPDEEIPLGKTLIRISSTVGSALTGVSADPAAVEEEIGRLAGKLRAVLRDETDPRSIVSALNRFLYDDEGFAYDCVAGDPENYLLHRVIARRRGNCLGLTALYLLLAERLSLPLHGVYVPSHCFLRYDDGGVRINIETGKKGAEWTDERYLSEFRLTERYPYMQPLGRKGMIAVYLKSIGAAFSRTGRDDHALRVYREAALFHPRLPDVYFNAGVSYQKKGLLDEAITQYRFALDLDPDLAVARDNIGVALARKGRFPEALAEARMAASLRPRNPVTRGNLAATLCAAGMEEECIREYRKVLEIDPDNARALAGLTKAHYARGEYREAIVTCDKAMACGWNPDPDMLGTLEKHRSPLPDATP